MLRQDFQLLIEHLQAFLRNIVRHYVVDRNLQVIQAGAVQALHPLGNQQIAVGDHSGHDAGGGAWRR